MKSKLSNLVVSLALILAGILFLAQNLGFIPKDAPVLWMFFFAAISVIFFIVYFLNGIREWGWLFPATISGALALTLGLVQTGFESALLGTPILLAVGLPFFVVFFMDGRKNWWAMIPASIMTMLAVIVGLADQVAGELIGTLVLLSIGLPFLVIYLMNREQRWALIPGLILAFISLIPLTVLLVSENMLPTIILMIIALPFLLVFLFSRQNWWALIPGGILGSIAIAFVAAGGTEINDATASLFVGVMFLGWAATFAILWLLRNEYPTSWAIYPAAALVLIGVSAFFFINSMELLGPLALILVGAMLLLNNLRRPRIG